MSRLFILVFVYIVLNVGSVAAGANSSTSDPKALLLASQSLKILTGNTAITDVTLTGTVTLIAGPDTETGSATLLALGTGESRLDLTIADGMRTEIRDASTGVAQGKWLAPGGASGLFASQNCATDAVWFFPVLSSLTASPKIVLSYVGQETRLGLKVEHIRSYLYQVSHFPTMTPREPLSNHQC
ncbi:MAG: hypothetical protein ACRD4E_14825 [Bryobacteraceae bacterium]